MVDVSERFRRMPSRLPRFDCTQRRPRCEIADNKQERSRHTRDDDPTSLQLFETPLFGGEHEIAFHGKVEQYFMTANPKRLVLSSKSFSICVF
ncbi:MAG: hypothetical protein DME30_11065 [Verrucomicrobia bacterium]|nr:MAG: hypothetical protein DME30_11065 [Verrucomicrobiota bacterium]